MRIPHGLISLAAVVTATVAAAGCGGGGGGSTTGASAIGPMGNAEAKKVLDPIIARAEAGGYTSYQTGPHAGFSQRGAQFSANLTVWATPAAARSVGLALKQTPDVKSGAQDFVVIGTREWVADRAADPQMRDPAGPLRRLVEVAEGCAPNCDFSLSSVK